MRSLLAGWRVSLRRTLADWPIVAAAWLITLLAAVLLAAGPIYSSAASEAGLRRALVDAPVADTNIQVSLYVAPADASAVDDDVQTELQRVIAPLGGSTVRDWRGSATFALSGVPEGEVDDQALVGFLEGLAGHATLVDGGWPADSNGPSEPIQVVVVDAVANELRLGVGDELSLVVYYLDPTQAEPVRMEVPARLVGIFALDAVADPYWNGDEQLIQRGQGERAVPNVRTVPDHGKRPAATRRGRIGSHEVAHLSELRATDGGRRLVTPESPERHAPSVYRSPPARSLTSRPDCPRFWVMPSVRSS